MITYLIDIEEQLLDNLQQIIRQISNTAFLLPPINISLKYSEYDREICFKYDHPEYNVSTKPFNVLFSSVGQIEQRTTANNTPYLVGVGVAQKQILVNIFEQPIDAIIEVADVLFNEAKEKQTSSLLITKEGSGFFVQWIYNQYQEELTQKKNEAFREDAKRCALESKNSFLKDNSKINKSKDLKRRQTQLSQEKTIKFFCDSCELFSATRLCENCHSNQVSLSHPDISLDMLISNIASGMQRGLFN